MSLIDSDSFSWWQASWILPCWIQPLPSWIQTPCYLLSDSLKNTLIPLWHWLRLIQSDSNLFILTQHLKMAATSLSPFAQKKNFTHWFWLNLMMAAILNSAIMLSGFSHLSVSSETHFPPTICTKDWFPHLHFHHKKSSILDSLRISSPPHHWHICTKKTSLIDSDSFSWWQPSWILPCWIQTLPSWIQTPCYLLSDSLKNTLTLTLTETNSIWLKLIYCHLTW